MLSMNFGMIWVKIEQDIRWPKEALGVADGRGGTLNSKKSPSCQLQAGYERLQYGGHE